MPNDNTYNIKDKEIIPRLKATVGHSGKNLLDMTKYTAQGGTSNIQINETTGSLSYTGTGTHVSVSFYAADLGVEMYGKTYTVSCINNLASTADGRFAIRKANTNQIVTRVGFGSTGKKSITFTPDVETFPNGWYISVMATGSTSTTGKIDISNFMLREASISDDTFEPYQEPTDSLIETKARAYLNRTVGHACKNLLNLKNLSSVTRKGVTWTVDPVAGTITANGTATAQSLYWDVRFTLSKGNYYFSGCPSGGDLSTYDLYPWDSTTNSRPKKWDGSTNAPSDFDGTKKQFQVVNNHVYALTCRVEAGVTVNNLVFKPMVWDGSIADDTFEPYQEPTDRLIETKARAYLNSTVGHSSKNLLDLTKYRASTDVTDIVIDPETGSVSANASGTYKSIYFNDENIQFENGKTYVVSCTNNVVNASGCLSIRNQVTFNIYKSVSFNTLGVKSITFTPNTTDFPNRWLISLFITRASGADSNIDISELMLKEVSISDDTFEPYQEPTDSLIETKARAYLTSTVGHTCKNYISYDTSTYTYTANGITFTLDPSAGTVTANGTATANTEFRIPFNHITTISGNVVYTKKPIKSGKYYFCGSPSGGTSTSYWCFVYDNTTGSAAKKWNGTSGISRDYGDVHKNEVLIDDTHSQRFTIMIANGYTASNVVFRPMIWSGDIDDDTFEPYVTPTDEAKQDKPVVLYDAGESSMGAVAITHMSNLTQYSELHITLFSPKDKDDISKGGFTRTIVHSFILPDNSWLQEDRFDYWITEYVDGKKIQKRVGMSLRACTFNTIGGTIGAVEILGEINEQNGVTESIPSNHYIYIKRIVGIP